MKWPCHRNISSFCIIVPSTRPFSSLSVSHCIAKYQQLYNVPLSKKNNARDASGADDAIPQFHDVTSLPSTSPQQSLLLYSAQPAASAIHGPFVIRFLHNALTGENNCLAFNSKLLLLLNVLLCANVDHAIGPPNGPFYK